MGLQQASEVVELVDDSDRSEGWVGLEQVMPCADGGIEIQPVHMDTGK
ncbi:hypothetical protein ACH429_03440 [Streptomyces pathocidini]|uniref:Uncharacterized protein n=1 Tax=Streptomyces pathocidini TaxID=1650571 RepID=A0ABW7UKI4_9ACTN|nr:hypothetical protein [Streptomyces pathocidini]